MISFTYQLPFELSLTPIWDNKGRLYDRLRLLVFSSIKLNSNPGFTSLGLRDLGHKRISLKKRFYSRITWKKSQFLILGKRLFSHCAPPNFFFFFFNFLPDKGYTDFTNVYYGQRTYRGSFLTKAEMLDYLTSGPMLLRLLYPPQYPPKSLTYNGCPVIICSIQFKGLKIHI